MRNLIVWALLVGATCISLFLGETRKGGGDLFWLAVPVLGIAYVKVYIVMMEFMELRHAPAALRIVGLVWLVATLSALLAMFAWSHLLVATFQPARSMF